MARGPRGSRPAASGRPDRFVRLTLTFSVAVPRTERLDRFLADQLRISRAQAGRLIAAQKVEVAGRRARASHTASRGAVISVALPDDAPPQALAPRHLELTFAYEDDHLAVLDKPPGLVVHPAPGHWDDTLVNALIGRGTPLASGEGRPGVVHRLDRDTSGLLIVAKTELAHRRLGGALAHRQVRRRYAALAWGHLARDPLVIDAPLARHPHDRKRVAVLAGGRPARTMARVVARFALVDLLRLTLESGRTHQIRVHLSHVGHPVVGDPVYGGGGARRVTGSSRPEAEELARLVPRQALHAAELAFQHPVTGTPLVVRSEWPADLRGGLARAASDPNLLARDNPLQYLDFFTSDD